MHRARPVHLHDHVLVREHALVPELEDPLLRVPQHIRVKVVQRIRPRLVRVQQRIARVLHQRPRREPRIARGNDDARIQHEMLLLIGHDEPRLRCEKADTHDKHGDKQGEFHVLG
jgi:hypothetical protein